MAEEKKINFYRECQDLVDREVYCCVTEFVDYIVKVQSEDFWEEMNDKCPLVYSDIEYKGWSSEEDKYSGDEYDEDDDSFWYYEAYYVSDWFADLLYEHDEFVARYKYSPCIWFRRTTGQAICIDGVIDEITREILVYRGKCTEEEAKELSIC